MKPVFLSTAATTDDVFHVSTLKLSIDAFLNGTYCLVKGFGQYLDHSVGRVD